MSCFVWQTLSRRLLKTGSGFSSGFFVATLIANLCLHKLFRLLLVKASFPRLKADYFGLFPGFACLASKARWYLRLLAGALPQPPDRRRKRRRLRGPWPLFCFVHKFSSTSVSSAFSFPSMKRIISSSSFCA